MDDFLPKQKSAELAMPIFDFHFGIACNVINVVQNNYINSPFEKTYESKVLLENRINKILIAISTNCSLEKFQKMIKNYIELEKQAFLVANASEWLLFVSFGNERLTQIQNLSSIDEYLNATTIYGKAIVENVRETVRSFGLKNEYCDKKLRKMFALIISYICLFIDLENPKNEDSSGFPCYKNYQDVSLMFGSPDDYIDCIYNIDLKRPIKNYLPYDWTSYMNAPFHVLSSDRLRDNIETYTDMNVHHSLFPKKTMINLLILVNDDFKIPYNIFENIFLLNDLCKDGTFFGMLHYLFNNNTQQNFNTISLPINVEPLNSLEHFIWNYENLRNQSTTQEFDGNSCNNIKRFLEVGNNMTLNGEQYIILILQDPYPSCLEFDLKWDNKNVCFFFHKYFVNSNFIKFSTNGLNHITFYNIQNASSDEISDLFMYSTICASSLPMRTIRDQPRLIAEPPETSSFNLLISSTAETDTTDESFETNTFSNGSISSSVTYSTESTDSSSTSTNIPTELNPIFELELWHIICFVILILATTIISIKLIFMLIQAKNQKKIQNQLLDRGIKAFEMQSSSKYWKTFLDDKSVVIHFDCILGKGSNSTVYKCLILRKNPFSHIYKNFITTENSSAAVKITKHLKTNNPKEFITEMDALILLKSHANIVTLLGWTLCGDTPVLITELASTNLLAYVQSCTIQNDESFIKFALQILWQISNGLKYITDQKMIHRDVACRNILLFDNNVAKIADFGLCCKCDETGIFKDSKHEKFPLKWLSIEAILDGIFSEKSDSWAFGILCFEVFSFGAIPYEAMSTSEMIEYLESGKRLPQPTNTPNLSYEIMLNCWRKDPNNRPSFDFINKKIAAYLEEDTLKYGYLALKKVFKNI